MKRPRSQSSDVYAYVIDHYKVGHELTQPNIHKGLPYISAGAISAVLHRLVKMGDLSIIGFANHSNRIYLYRVLALKYCAMRVKHPRAAHANTLGQTGRKVAEYKYLFHHHKHNAKATPATKTTSSVLAEVAYERIRQIAKWNKVHNDDAYTALDWHEIIADYNAWARRMAAMPRPAEARKRYLQVAALAVAAIEALDRRQPK